MIMKKNLLILFAALLMAGCQNQNQNKETMHNNTLKPGKNRISFQSEGLTLVGDLYIPEDYKAGNTYPGLVVGGSWTTVKEQMAGLYAQKMADNGFVALAFDHSNYGESEGDARFYEDPEAKKKDFVNAMNYLKSLEVVAEDRTGGMGVCASGGYMAQAVAIDDDYKSFASVVPWFNTKEIVNAFYGGEEGINARIEKSRAAKSVYEATGEVQYQLTISDSDPTAAMYGPFDYYLDPAIGQVSNWSHDKFAVMNWEPWLTYRPLGAADAIDVPVVIINSEQAATPAASSEFVNRLKGEKKEIWIEGGQLEFYYKDAQVGASVAELVKHFKATL